MKNKIKIKTVLITSISVLLSEATNKMFKKERKKRSTNEAFQG